MMDLRLSDLNEMYCSNDTQVPLPLPSVHCYAIHNSMVATFVLNGHFTMMDLRLSDRNEMYCTNDTQVPLPPLVWSLLCCTHCNGRIVLS